MTHRSQYCPKLNPVLYAYSRFPTGWKHYKIVIDPQDRIAEQIEASGQYFLHGLLPKMGATVETHDTQSKVDMLEQLDVTFVLEQDPCIIDIGVTVFSVTRMSIGVVQDICWSTVRATVAWEGEEDRKRMRACNLENLIPTPVRKRIEPRSIGERIVIMGAKDRSYIGKKGWTKTVTSTTCEVSVDDDPKPRRFSKSLLHALSSSETKFFGENRVYVAERTSDPALRLKRLNEYLIRNGHFQVYRSFTTMYRQRDIVGEVQKSLEDVKIDEVVIDEGKAEDFQHYSRLVNKTVVCYTRSRHKSMAQDIQERSFSLWLNDEEIDVYSQNIKKNLATLYNRLQSDGLLDMPLIWILPGSVYNSITARDDAYYTRFWKHIPQFVDFILIPLCVAQHWTLVVVVNPLTPEEAYVLQLNSMESTSDVCTIEMDKLQLFLSAGYLSRYGDIGDFKELSIQVCKSPQQPNCHDCGPYILGYMDLFVELISQIKSTNKMEIMSAIEQWTISQESVKGIRTRLHQMAGQYKPSREASLPQSTSSSLVLD